MEFDRLTQWIADTLSTDAADDTPDPTPPGDAHAGADSGTTKMPTTDDDVDEFALFGALR
jgi:hypothetical protein